MTDGALYGVALFTSKKRVRVNGVPIKIRGRPMGFVNIKSTRDFDAWCKVRALANDGEYELMDILGPAGNPFIEQTVRLGESGILPCRYPNELQEYESSEYDTENEVVFQDDAITYDNAGTEDMDDAISLSADGSVLGIHITDTTRLFEDLELDRVAYAWAEARTSSAYPSPMPDGLTRRAIHMLPGNLGSLVRSNKIHPCISLIVVLVEGVPKRFEWLFDARVKVTKNCEYSQMDERVRTVLSKLSGSQDPADMIAWTMTTYNLEFAKLNLPGTIFRVSRVSRDSQVSSPSRTGACYSLDASLGHESFEWRPYAHATSPMRRFADFHNQRVIRGIFSKQVDVDRLNDRDAIFRRFHAEDAVMSLAIMCARSPLFVKVRLCEEMEERKGSVCLELESGRRIRVPVHDSFLYDGVVLSRAGSHVELHGIVKDGRAQLRMRLCSSMDQAA